VLRLADLTRIIIIITITIEKGEMKTFLRYSLFWCINDNKKKERFFY